ncbi:MAG: FixH family protein [Sphingomonadales bacterium]
MSAAMQPKPFTGRHMLAVMVGFFAVVIGVNAALALFAAKSWTGLVVQNAYVASQHFNEDLAIARRQQALGWHSTLAYGRGILRFDVAGASGAAMPGLTVAVTLRRPTHEGEDRQLTLSPTASGRYQAAVDLGRGTWNAEVAATDPLGRPYRRDFRLWVGED